MVVFQPSGIGFPIDRYLDALLGGGVALAINALVDRSHSTVVDLLGGTSMDQADSSTSAYRGHRWQHFGA